MATEVARTRRAFTADEYERMVAAGILRPDERVELIRGEIVEMSPIGHRHAACVACLTKRFNIALDARAVVWVRGSVRVAFHSVPEPDLALLRPRSYRTSGPRPEEILLVVEVADSSLRYDRTEKVRLYAEAAIPEYWVVGVEEEWIEVYRSPEGGGYRERRRAGRGEHVTTVAFPDVSIPVGVVFA
jgi:Uma2 family endonuclease